MPKKEKIVVTFYGRVSTKAETQRLSGKENQPKFYLNLFKNPKISKEYEPYVDKDTKEIKMYLEWGKTGTNIKRPAFEDLLKDAGLAIDKKDYGDVELKNRPGYFVKQIKYNVHAVPDVEAKFEEIWVKSTSRLARTIAVYDILLTLRTKGVYVVFKDHDLTTRNNSDLHVIRQLLEADMQFSEALSKTTKLAKQQAIDEGILQTSGQLFGYNYFKRTRHNAPYYQINEDEAKAVKRIFEMCAYEGLGDQRIAKEVAKMGFSKKFPRPKKDTQNVEKVKGKEKSKENTREKDTNSDKEFSPSRIRGILMNEKYMGLLNAGKFTTGTIFLDKLSSPKITDNYKEFMHVSEYIPKIIEPELWEAAQEARKGRYTLNDKNEVIGIHKSKNEFANLLVCSYCGSNFNFDNNGGRAYYTCSKKENKGTDTEKGGCNVNNVYLYMLESRIEQLQKDELNFILETDAQKYLLSYIYLIEECFEQLAKPQMTEELLQAQAEVDRLTEIYNIYKAQMKEKPSKSLAESIAETGVELDKAAEDVKKYSMQPTDYLEKIKNMLKSCSNLMELLNSIKAEYTREEVIDRLEKIEVYGITENSTGGRPPRPILIPIIKETANIKSMVSVDLPIFKYSLRDGLEDYEAPEFRIRKKYKKIDSEPLHPADLDEIPKEERFNFPTKSYWTKVDLDYVLAPRAFAIENDELGYIKNLGVEGISIKDQIKDKLKELEEKAEKIHKEFSDFM